MELEQDMPSDEELAERACAGDQEALESLFLRHQLTLRAQVARHLANTDDVLDVVQDAFVAILNGLHTYQAGRPVLPWMRVICRNRMYLHLKRQRRSGAVPLGEREPEDAPVHESLWDEHAISQLQRCLETLPAHARELVDRRYATEQPIMELAAQLGITSNTLMVRLHRVRQGLRGDPLPPEERAACAAAQHDPAVQDELAFIAALATAANPVSDEALLRSLRTRLVATQDGEPQLRALRRRIGTRRRSQRRRAGTRAGLRLAAVIAVGVAVALLITTLRQRSAAHTDGVTVIDGVARAGGGEVRSHNRELHISGPGWQLALQQRSALRLGDQPSDDLVLLEGACRMTRNAAGSAPSLHIATATFTLEPASQVALQLHPEHSLAVIEAGSVSVREGNNGAAPRLLTEHQSMLLGTDGSTVPFDAREEVLRVDANDPAASPWLQALTLVDGALHSSPDPKPEINATTIDIKTPDERPLLRLRGDEVIVFTYRWSGPIRWSGAYLDCLDLGGFHASWDEPDPDGSAWRTRRLPLRAFATITGSEGIPPGLELRMLRLQMGPEHGTSLQLKDLRILRPQHFEFFH
ncbi:MAG: sigma-70 family RNA polymerase sigma factor [Planctomycetota bacterium]|nr:sigma-70 family RNA polymerase sigma factor [Planctomycetota bacterium]